MSAGARELVLQSRCRAAIQQTVERSSRRAREGKKGGGGSKFWPGPRRLPLLTPRPAHSTTQHSLATPPLPCGLRNPTRCSCSGLLCLAAGAGEGGAGSCEFSVASGGALYSFSLTSRTPAHRHGVLNEDGFYKVSVNDFVLWFQLCDQMKFNFEPPVCLDCEDCGGPLRRGTQCSALVSNNIGGYDVCTTIGRVSKSHISLIDGSNPQKGVVVKMFSSKCSISVFILCDTTVAQVSDKFILSGSCDYTTTLRHPSGCARSAASGNGWGWLGILFVTILCLLGGYILIGAIYRYYFLGIHSVEAIPNLEVWISLPQRIKSMFVPSARSPRGPSRHS